MLNPENYAVGWICAERLDATAAALFLDEKYNDPDTTPVGDGNNYILGRMGNHNVVIASLPTGQSGPVHAGTVGRDLGRTFPNVRIGLLVGVGEGAPSRKNDIRLGDVVVSTPIRHNGGVLQYEFNRKEQGVPIGPVGHLDKPPRFMLSAASGLETDHSISGHGIEEAMDMILSKVPDLRSVFERPSPASDRLFDSNFQHAGDPGTACGTACDLSRTTSRPERSEDETIVIHRGPVASANHVLHDAAVRDELAATEGIMCFETEAAGLMDHFPCVVVRGIQGYADSHGDGSWRGYAAMTAAAYAKQLVCKIPRDKNETARQAEAGRQALHNPTTGELAVWLIPGHKE